MYRFDDAALVAAIRAGDDAAFEELYARYRLRIAAYVTRLIGEPHRAEDVTQEVFLSALRAIRASDQAIAFRPWIYEIARNASIDHHRKASRAAQVEPLDEASALARCDDTTATSQALHERFELLCAALRDLPLRQRRLLAQREFAGLSYSELAKSNGLSVAAVETALHRARRGLAARVRLLGGELPAPARSKPRAGAEPERAAVAPAA
jgi:RNA polymerase sigma factor (sigma-70 family)